AADQEPRRHPAGAHALFAREPSGEAPGDHLPARRRRGQAVPGLGRRRHQPAAPAVGVKPPSAPRDLTARLLEIHDEAAGARTFRLSVPDDFCFIPGMWVMIQFPDKKEHASAYSISSSPLAKGHIDLSFF